MKRGYSMIWAAMMAVLACAVLTGPAAAEDPAQTPPASQATAGQKDAQSVIASWPATTKKAAQALIEKYGQPDGVTGRMLIWNDKGDWKQVAVYRDAVKHLLPMPHEDFLENTISYKVPENKVADLIKFDHALVVDETRGTLASHCDSEKANTLALNLANEIVTGRRDVASAKSFMKSTMMKEMAGKSSPYTEKLLFKPSHKSASTEQPGAPETGIEPAVPENPQPQQTPRQGY